MYQAYDHNGTPLSEHGFATKEEATAAALENIKAGGQAAVRLLRKGISPKANRHVIEQHLSPKHLAGKKGTLVKKTKRQL